MSLLRVGFIGAGGVNFGSPEGPWNHAQRLERIGGVQFVGIADPDTNRANKILQDKLQTKYAHMYQSANIRASFNELLDLDQPDLVFIGLPPECHGVTKEPFNVEVACAHKGVHMFIEKPLGAAPPEEVAETAKVLKKALAKGVISGVGYMFRYSKAIDKMKEILLEEAQKRGEKNHITMILAKFNCAYSPINKEAWWDMRKSGGPVVEQSTHVVDLARYLSESEVEESSLHACAIFPSDQPLSKLTDVPQPYGSSNENETVEDRVPFEHRIPRVTTATWRFQSGALCTLTHGVMLHGHNNEAEVEVWADGLRMTLEDPYVTCRLSVKRSRSDKDCGDQVQVYDFGTYGDADLTSDPYHNEVVAFLDAVRNKDPSLIRSSFEDAFKTYELTWAIRRASERFK
jgi:predicted dehydrogenase